MYNDYEEYLMALGEVEDPRKRAREEKEDYLDEKAESRRQEEW